VIDQPNMAAAKPPPSGKQCVDAILVDHARDQKAEDTGALPDFADRRPQFGQTVADRTLERPAPASIRCEQEHRQDEDGVPEGGNRARGTGVLALDRIKPEQRIQADQCLSGFRRSRQKGDDEDQHDHAAEIAQAPGEIGHPSDLRLRDEAQQHRIVEHDGKLCCHRGKGERHHNGDDAGTRRGKPQAAQGQDLEDCEERDPGFAWSGLIGNRPENG
jgi:hypothetical protein